MAFDFDAAATVTLPVTGATPGQMLLDHSSLTKILSAAVKGSPKAIVDQLDVTMATSDHTPVVHVAGDGARLGAALAVRGEDRGGGGVDRQDLAGGGGGDRGGGGGGAGA